MHRACHQVKGTRAVREMNEASKASRVVVMGMWAHACRGKHKQQFQGGSVWLVNSYQRQGQGQKTMCLYPPGS